MSCVAYVILKLGVLRNCTLLCDLYKTDAPRICSVHAWSISLWGSRVQTAVSFAPVIPGRLRSIDAERDGHIRTYVYTTTTVYTKIEFDPSPPIDSDCLVLASGGAEPRDHVQLGVHRRDADHRSGGPYASPAADSDAGMCVCKYEKRRVCRVCVCVSFVCLCVCLCVCKI